MKYFWDGLKHIQGVGVIYPKDAGSDKSGWYASRCHYRPEAFGGLSNKTFTEALNAEVGHDAFSYGTNFPLHLSSLFYDVDIYGQGKPTAAVYRNADDTDLRSLTGSLPVAEKINLRVLGDPWFKHLDKTAIDPYIEAIHKVSKHFEDLLAIDQGGNATGGVALSHRKTR